MYCFRILFLGFFSTNFQVQVRLFLLFLTALTIIVAQHRMCSPWVTLMALNSFATV